MPGKAARQKGTIMDELAEITRKACMPALIRSVTEPVALMAILDPEPHVKPLRWQMFKWRWTARRERLRDAWLVLKGDRDARYPDGW